MSHLGHPLFNDDKYGGNMVRKGTVFSKYKSFVENNFKMLPRHALHAISLGFIHPQTKEKVKFETAIPDDMQKVLERWKDYVHHQKKKK